MRLGRHAHNLEPEPVPGAFQNLHIGPLHTIAELSCTNTRPRHHAPRGL
jgi:hypothetical protein